LNKDLISSLAWAGGILALAVVASFGRQQSIVDDETVTRVVVCAIGLMVAWHGNRTPKAVHPTALAQQIARVGGWAFALSGLVYAGLWAFAPIPVAVVGGCAALLAGIAVTVGNFLRLRAKAKAT
jgi:hypothetical protein